MVDWISTWDVTGEHGTIDIMVATVEEWTGQKRTHREMERIACLLAREDGRIGRIIEAKVRL